MSKKKGSYLRNRDYKKYSYPRLVPPTFDAEDVEVSKRIPANKYDPSKKKKRGKRNKAQSYVKFNVQKEIQKRQGKKAKKRSVFNQKFTLDNIKDSDRELVNKIINQRSSAMFSAKYQGRIKRYLAARNLVYNGYMDIGESVYNYLIATVYARPNRDPSHNKQYYVNLLFEDNFDEAMVSDFLRGNSLDDVIQHWIDYHVRNKTGIIIELNDGTESDYNYGGVK